MPLNSARPPKTCQLLLWIPFGSMPAGFWNSTEVSTTLICIVSKLPYQGAESLLWMPLALSFPWMITYIDLIYLSYHLNSELVTSQFSSSRWLCSLHTGTVFGNGKTSDYLLLGNFVYTVSAELFAHLHVKPSHLCSFYVQI